VRVAWCLWHRNSLLWPASLEKAQLLGLPTFFAPHSSPPSHGHARDEDRQVMRAIPNCASSTLTQARLSFTAAAVFIMFGPARARRPRRASIFGHDVTNSNTRDQNPQSPIRCGCHSRPRQSSSCWDGCRRSQPLNPNPQSPTPNCAPATLTCRVQGAGVAHSGSGFKNAGFLIRDLTPEVPKPEALPKLIPAWKVTFKLCEICCSAGRCGCHSRPRQSSSCSGRCRRWHTTKPQPLNPKP